MMQHSAPLTDWRSLAAHEAGHCLAFEFFGCEVDRAELRFDGGRTIGMDAILAAAWYGDKFLTRWAAAEIKIIAAVAGAVGQQQFTGIACGLGDTDRLLVDDALKLLGATGGRRDTTIIRGFRRASALIGSARGRQFIARLSKDLLAHRRIDGETCWRVFTDVFGQPPPRLEAWLRYWPPDLPMLAEGRLPGELTPHRQSRYPAKSGFVLRPSWRAEPVWAAASGR